MSNEREYASADLDGQITSQTGRGMKQTMIILRNLELLGIQLPDGGATVEEIYNTAVEVEKRGINVSGKSLKGKGVMEVRNMAAKVSDVKIRACVPPEVSWIDTLSDKERMLYLKSKQAKLKQ